MSDVNTQHFSRADVLRANGYTVLAAAARSDAYTFYFVIHPNTKEKLIVAGCQELTPAQYRRHTKIYDEIYGKRKGTAKRKETLAIIDALLATANAKWSK